MRFCAKTSKVLASQSDKPSMGGVMQNQNETKTHPFARTLGAGPYRIVGFFALILPSEANQGRNNFHMAPKDVSCGTCAHCGTGIINNFIVQSGDGKKHAIGSDCIEKVGLPHSEMTKMQRIEKERQKKQRAERKVKKGGAARAELKQLIESQKQTLQSLPHPSDTPDRFVKRSLYDYATWCVDKSGDGGIVIVLKRVKALIEKGVSK